MKKIILSAASLAVAAVASVSVVPTTAEAVPAFARQTGAACLNCHFQTIPRLSAMGREFRANAFTDIAIDVIEDDHLSLPATFGASVLFKARFGTNDGGNNWDSGSKVAFQYPDEAALLMGGRLGEHTGALAEWAGGPLSYKLVHMIPAGEGSVGVVIASTDALGTAYAFNNPSNALIRNTRGSQFRPGFLKNSSVQNGVTGYGAYYTNDMIHVGAAQFINNFEFNPSGPAGNAAMPFGAGLISFDANWKGDIADFDTVATIYSISGTQKIKAEGPSGANGDGIREDYSESTAGIALQMQGELGDSLAGLYFVYQFSGEQKDAAGAVAADLTGFNLLGTYSINPSFSLKAGYSSTTDAGPAGVVGGDATANTIVVGAVYDIIQNFVLDLEFNSTSGDKYVTDDVTGITSFGTDASDEVSTTLLIEYVY